MSGQQETIAFVCPACGHELHFAAEHVGRKGRCNHCRHVFVLTRPAGSDGQAQKTQPRITFTCPLCNHRLTVAAHAAGRTCHCPGCSARVRIPARQPPGPANSPPPRAPAGPPPTRPSPDDTTWLGLLDNLAAELLARLLALPRRLAAFAHAHRRGLLRATLATAAMAILAAVTYRWVLPLLVTVLTNEVTAVVLLVAGSLVVSLPVLALGLLTAKSLFRHQPSLLRPLLLWSIRLGPPATLYAIFAYTTPPATREPMLNLLIVFLLLAPLALLARWLFPYIRVGLITTVLAILITLGAVREYPQLQELLSPLVIFSLCYAPLWLVSRPLSFTLLASLIRTARCPGCYEDYPLVNRWSCSCGYHDHKQRHFYRFICPKCRSRLGSFDCPRCDATILL